jgi:hypothetical protein
MKNYFKVLGISFSLFITLIFTGCEEENLENMQNFTSDVNLSEFIDISYYQEIKDVGEEINPPYYFVWQIETTIHLEEECSCLPTDEGNCLWEIIVRPTKADVSPYDIFLPYYESNSLAMYYTKENWQELFPMLKESTVSNIINGNLNLHHKYNESEGIAYFIFYFSDKNPTKSENIIFTIRLNISA